MSTGTALTGLYGWPRIFLEVCRTRLKVTQKKLNRKLEQYRELKLQSVLSDIDSTETYSMKLFIAPFGLQDTKTIFFRNGEFLNALTTCGSEIWVGYH